MPPKQKKAKTSTSNSYNKHIFVSEAAVQRYNDYKRRRTAIPERGLDLAGPINEQIQKRNMSKLVEQPEPAVASLVMEFYANAAEKGVKDTVFVRGKQVCFSSSSINRFYGLPDEGEFDNFLQNHVDWMDVIHVLCKSDTNWTYCSQDGEVSSFPTKSMAASARVWFYFIAAKLMPVSHTSSVHRTRAALIFAIINDIPINVGKLMYQSIRYSIDDESLAFVCPCLISSLCKQAGVPRGGNEVLMPEKGILNSKTLSSLKDIVSGFEGNQDFDLPPPPPRKETLGKRVENLGKRLHDHCHDFDTFKANCQTAIQAQNHRLEEFFEYQRQTNEVLHQAIAQLARRQAKNLSLPQLPPFPYRNDDTDSGPSRPH